MGIMVYAVLWVMQDLYHQPYEDGKAYSDSMKPYSYEASKIETLNRAL